MVRYDLQEKELVIHLAKKQALVGAQQAKRNTVAMSITQRIQHHLIIAFLIVSNLIKALGKYITTDSVFFQVFFLLTLCVSSFLSLL